MKIKQSSFTIVESLIAMSLFALVMITASVGISSLKQIKHYQQAISFYQMLIQLESPNRNYQLQFDGDKLEFVNPDKPELIYDLKVSKNRLIMSTSEGGTMPLLDHVRSFANQGRDIQVVFEDGQSYNGKLLNAEAKREEP